MEARDRLLLHLDRGHRVTAVIAEDEANLRDELREALGGLWPELVLCGAAADGDEALRLLDEYEPDVLFLDIEMPGMSGLELAQRANGRAHVVFVTAYDKYAVDAFDRGAVDYLLKPFDEDRLAEAIRRVKARINSTPAELDELLKALYQRLGAGRDYLRWITVSEGREFRFITVDEICYFRADNKCTLVVTAERESVIFQSIKDLLGMLDPSAFWQIHRGTIVNARHIAGIVRDARGRMNVRLKQRRETLPVSAPYEYRFRRL